MIDLSTIRNPSVEHLGAPVIVSAALCEKAGIALAYVGLQGTVIEVDAKTGEVLVHLGHASHERFVCVQGAAFSKSYRDLDEEQWFVSGVLEVVIR